jgi:alkanesulfonate monooxygenase SsuD/methylene tetrahydromethanopterin reductase-like flavin-dependent oxidoreductase (luciferase family)
VRPSDKDVGMTPVVAAILPPNLTPEQLLHAAHVAEQSGVAEVWVWEDCFKETGIASAAAILGSTERLTVGIGLLPVPLRNVALTAMEIATLARMFPGRLLPGIGHGVLDWMGQVGARVDSPMTLLREYATALRALLHGERLTVDGRYVHLDDVALDWPPTQVPPLLVGAVKEKTVQLAADCADGVILTGGSTPADTAAVAQRFRSGRDRPGEVVTFTVAPDDPAALPALVAEHAAAGATRIAVLPSSETLGDDAPLLALLPVLADC